MGARIRHEKPMKDQSSWKDLLPDDPYIQEMADEKEALEEFGWIN